MDSNTLFPFGSFQMSLLAAVTVLNKRIRNLGKHLTPDLR